MTDTTELEAELRARVKHQGPCAECELFGRAADALASARTDLEAHRAALFQVLLNLGEDTDGITDAAYWDRVVTPKLVDDVPDLVAKDQRDTAEEFDALDAKLIAALGRVTELEAKIAEALARHVENRGSTPRFAYDDPHAEREPTHWEEYVICAHEGTKWPCFTVATLNPALSTDSKDDN